MRFLRTGVIIKNLCGRLVVLLGVARVDLRGGALFPNGRLEAQEVLEHRCRNVNQISEPVEKNDWLLGVQLPALDLLQLFVNDFLHFRDDAGGPRLTLIDLIGVKKHLDSQV